MYLKWRLHRILNQTRNALAAPSRQPRMAVVLGRLLAAAFLVCFATGLYSHFLQDPFEWMVFLSRPVWLYQVSQGIHITAGIACIPLLLAKLYVVFPALFQTPPVRSGLHLVERASIALFVSASLVQLAIGVLNTYQLYSVFPFSFRHTHFMLSWVIIGSLAIHIAVKLPTIAEHWRKTSGELEAYSDASDDVASDEDAVPADPVDELQRLTGVRPTAGFTGKLFAWIDRAPAQKPMTPGARASRRGFLITVASASAALVALTAGQSFRVLDATNLLAPRKNGRGPQGFSVNHTASAAKVLQSAQSPLWTLTVANSTSSVALNYEQLRALPQFESWLPIACVEGWSQYARWRGPRLMDLMDLVGAPQDATVRITSLQRGSSYAVTMMPANFVRDPLTLVALELNGETLHLDHGYPARIIAPARPGVLQTKWLSSLEVAT